ncbi:MAG: hypothetical protein IH867_10890 [Chloroflexi bacterium]|nr:hypothetical protein [Chloroflexota bacterium]
MRLAVQPALAPAAAHQRHNDAVHGFVHASRAHQAVHLPAHLQGQFGDAATQGAHPLVEATLAEQGEVRSPVACGKAQEGPLRAPAVPLGEQGERDHLALGEDRLATAAFRPYLA